jgi:hypothetical protein
VSEIPEDFHSILSRILNEIENSYEKFEKPIKKRPLKINAPQNRCVLHYKPDYCLEYKVSKVASNFLIFEFIDEQEEAKIIADITRIILFKNCRKAIFLAPDDDKHKMINNTIKVVVGGFTDMLGEKSKKDVLDIVCLKIPIKKLKEKEIKDILLDEIKKVTKL